MDILRNIFGTLTSGVIRLLVSVGILAAAYFFIVKPVLHKTDNAIKNATKSVEKRSGPRGPGPPHISGPVEDVHRRGQRQTRHSFHAAKKEGGPKRLVRCI